MSEQNIPELRNHFIREGMLPPVYLFQWFLTLFVTSLPLQTVVILWDYILSEGLHVLLPLTIALLKVLERYLLRQSFEEMLKFLKSLKISGGYDDTKIGRMLVRQADKISMPDELLTMVVRVDIKALIIEAEEDEKKEGGIHLQIKFDSNPPPPCNFDPFKELAAEGEKDWNFSNAKQQKQKECSTNAQRLLAPKSQNSVFEEFDFISEPARDSGCSPVPLRIGNLSTYYDTGSIIPQRHRRTRSDGSGKVETWPPDPPRPPILVVGRQHSKSSFTKDVFEAPPNQQGGSSRGREVAESSSAAHWSDIKGSEGVLKSFARFFKPANQSGNKGGGTHGEELASMGAAPLDTNAIVDDEDC